MTNEEINKCAEYWGLDGKRLTLFEPWYDKNLKARRYRFEYKTTHRVYDWNFLIESDPPLEFAIRSHVSHGLSKLAQAIKEAGYGSI